MSMSCTSVKWIAWAVLVAAAGCDAESGQAQGADGNMTGGGTSAGQVGTGGGTTGRTTAGLGETGSVAGTSGQTDTGGAVTTAGATGTASAGASTSNTGAVGGAGTTASATGTIDAGGSAGTTGAGDAGTDGGPGQSTGATGDAGVTSIGTKVTVDASGKYTVTFARPPWTFGGDLGAPATSISSSAGSDAVGPYHETTFSYTQSGTRSGRIRAYDQLPAVIFGEKSSTSAANIRNFPRLSSLPATAYHLGYTDVQFAPYSFQTLAPDSPWMFFDASANAYILSGASHFMNVETRRETDNAISVGIAPQIGTLPPDFEQTTVLAADAGINRTFEDWGDVLLKLGGKKAVASDATPDLASFGYWTDHGGTYYYKTQSGSDYPTTLENVKTYFQQQSLPIGYVQLDSWWYPKGANDSWEGDGTTDRGGEYLYQADKTLFPSGLPSFQQSLGLPLVVHARWIDPASPYRSMYKMSNDVSTDPAFWNAIASYLKAGGVGTYEQDWLRKEALPVTTNLTDQDAFLDNMAQAMQSAGLGIQYCMALPRHYLQSTKYQNVMTARASEDRFGRDRWRPFFYTSRLIAALGFWPWTDVFASSERDNLLVSTMSGGMMGVGDAIGSVDRASIMRAMRADGMLVKPDTALLLTDRSIIAEAQGKTSPTIATARTEHAGGITTYVFGFTDNSASMSFTPAELGYAGSVYVYDVNHNSGRLLAATQANTDTISDTAYYIVAPVGRSGIALLGEQGKLASVGKKRISSWSDDGTLAISVAFASGEKSVTLFGYAPSAPTASADVGAAGAVQYDGTAKRFTVMVSPAGGAASVKLGL